MAKTKAGPSPAETITNAIIARLEAGVRPWVQPWRPGIAFRAMAYPSGSSSRRKRQVCALSTVVARWARRRPRRRGQADPLPESAAML